MIPKELHKHIFWGMIVVVLACLGMVAFGNEAAVQTGQGTLGGIGFLILCLGFMYCIFGDY